MDTVPSPVENPDNNECVMIDRTVYNKVLETSEENKKLIEYLINKAQESAVLKTMSDDEKKKLQHYSLHVWHKIWPSLDLKAFRVKKNLIDNIVQAHCGLIMEERHTRVKTRTQGQQTEGPVPRRGGQGVPNASQISSKHGTPQQYQPLYTDVPVLQMPAPGDRSHMQFQNPYTAHTYPIPRRHGNNPYVHKSFFENPSVPKVATRQQQPRYQFQPQQTSSTICTSMSRHPMSGAISHQGAGRVLYKHGRPDESSSHLHHIPEHGFVRSSLLPTQHGHSVQSVRSNAYLESGMYGSYPDPGTSSGPFTSARSHSESGSSLYQCIPPSANTSCSDPGNSRTDCSTNWWT